MQSSLSESLSFLKIEAQSWTYIDLSAIDKPLLYDSDFVSVYFTINGTGRIAIKSVNSNDFMTMRNGDVIVVFPGQAHALHEGCVLQGGRARSSRIIRGILKIRWPAGFDCSRMQTVIKVNQTSNPLNLLQLANMQQSLGMEPVLARAALFVLICAIRDHPECDDIFREANFRDPIARAIQYMEMYPFRNWTVSTLARKVGMGRSAFASRFLMEVGKPPIKALTGLRMKMAASLLTQTHLKITDVAERVGYHSESAFLRRFLAHFKTTPSKMRMQYQERNATPITLNLDRSTRGVSSDRINAMSMPAVAA